MLVLMTSKGLTNPMQSLKGMLLTFKGGEAINYRELTTGCTKTKGYLTISNSSSCWLGFSLICHTAMLVLLQALSRVGLFEKIIHHGDAAFWGSGPCSILIAVVQEQSEHQQLYSSGNLVHPVT